MHVIAQESKYNIIIYSIYSRTIVIEVIVIDIKAIINTSKGVKVFSKKVYVQKLQDL